MNYVWRDAIIHFVRGELSASDFHQAVMTLCEHYPADALNVTMNLLSTHDTPRILTVLGIDGVPGTREERAGFRLSPQQLALAKNRLQIAAFLLFCLPGMPCIYYGDEIGMEGFEDPFNRAYMGDRTGDEEISTTYRDLAALKNGFSAMSQGALAPAFFQDGVYAFYRTEKDQRILCMVNISDSPKPVGFFGKTLFARNVWEEKGENLLLPYGCIAIKVQ